MRSAVEIIDELGLTQRAIAVFGIGCYTAFSGNLDVEVLQALHGRAPSLATGVKRAKPDTIVFTVQGDGDMVNEGLQEVIHTAARGENVTGHPPEQRGVRRDRRAHDGDHRPRSAHQEHARRARRRASTAIPILISDLLARLRGSGLRGPGGGELGRQVSRTRRMLRRAFELQAPARRVHLRRDPDHVPDRLVHRDHRGAATTSRTTWHRCTSWACSRTSATRRRWPPGILNPPVRVTGVPPSGGLLIGDVLASAQQRVPGRPGSDAPRPDADLRRGRGACRPSDVGALGPRCRGWRQGGLVGRDDRRRGAPLLRPRATGRRAGPAQSAPLER